MKNKIYLLLYYIISISIILISIYSTYVIDMYEFVNNPIISFSLILISILLLIINTILLIKRKNINITNKDLIFEIIYLIFIFIIIICCLIFDKKLLIPHIEYHYYLTIIIIPYLLLNINTMLSISKKITKTN